MGVNNDIGHTLRRLERSVGRLSRSLKRTTTVVPCPDCGAGLLQTTRGIECPGCGALLMVIDFSGPIRPGRLRQIVAGPLWSARILPTRKGNT